MSAAFNQVDQLILTPTTLCMLSSLIRNTSFPNRESKSEKIDVLQRFPAQLTTGCVRKLINCNFVLRKR